MSDLSTRKTSSARLSAGIKLAALVFTLGAIALAADLAWMIPDRSPGQDEPRASAPANEPAGSGYPAPSVPPGAEVPEHIQAF